MLLAFGHTDAQHCTSRSEALQHLIYVVLLLLQAVQNYSSQWCAVAARQHQEEAAKVVQADVTGPAKIHAAPEQQSQQHNAPPVDLGQHAGRYKRWCTPVGEQQVSTKAAQAGMKLLVMPFLVRASHTLKTAVCMIV
jgi:P2-related tail formation protein